MLRNERDLVEAVSEIDRGRIGALIISNGGGVNNHPSALPRIGELIRRQRLPAITDVAGSVLDAAGCVLAYAPNMPEILGRLAHFVDRILRGADPALLPFELPSRFELTVNAKSAEAIGLTMPASVLLRANRVIE